LFCSKFGENGKGQRGEFCARNAKSNTYDGWWKSIDPLCRSVTYYCWSAEARSPGWTDVSFYTYRVIIPFGNTVIMFCWEFLINSLSNQNWNQLP
jgi:uncharacterized membrane protein